MIKFKQTKTIPNKNAFFVLKVQNKLLMSETFVGRVEKNEL